MSKTKARMIGLLLMIISVFPLYGGLIMDSAWLALAGLAVMVTGIVFFKVIKSDEDLL